MCGAGNNQIPSVLLKIKQMLGSIVSRLASPRKILDEKIWGEKSTQDGMKRLEMHKM